MERGTDENNDGLDVAEDVFTVVTGVLLIGDDNNALSEFGFEATGTSPGGPEPDTLFDTEFCGTIAFGFDATGIKPGWTADPTPCDKFCCIDGFGLEGTGISPGGPEFAVILCPTVCWMAGDDTIGGIVPLKPNC